MRRIYACACMHGYARLQYVTYAHILDIHIYMRTLFVQLGWDLWCSLFVCRRKFNFFAQMHSFIHAQQPMPVPDDVMSYRRGVAAYTGLNRTDPDAIWSFQGWAFIGCVVVFLPALVLSW